MARNPLYRSRFDEEHQREFNKLMARLNLTDTHGAESETLRRAVVLANKHLDLKKKFKDFMNNIFGGFID